MKTVNPSIPSSLRLGLTSIIVLMVMSSPVVMLVNPALKAAPSTTGDYTSLAPSTIGQDGNDFTAQAPLSSVSARQTNNIVGVQSYYDVVFRTSTTGTIKFIDITFPAGTLIGAAPLLVEREGIGAGTAAKTSATVIRYTVTSAVSVPANTQIRLEFFNIVNPTAPSTGYKITVTTRNAAGTVIDGPTLSNGFSMKQIGSGQIADFAVTNDKIANDALSLFAIQRFGQFEIVPPGTVVEVTANCLSGQELVSGGHIIGADNAFDVRYVDSTEFNPNSWRVRVGNAGSGAMSVGANVLCIPSSFP